MATKSLYINDLIHRFPSHTFTETTVGSMTKVEFKNASSVLIGVATKLSVVDACRLIRDDLLDAESPEFLSTTVERDALTSVDKGTTILNVTTGRNEVYSGSSWESAAGAGVAGKIAFGSMYEDSASGSAMDSTSKRWVTATQGAVDSNGIVTFSDDSTGDRLVVGTGGAGSYVVSFSCSFTNSGNNDTVAAVHVNDVENVQVKDDADGSSTQHRHLIASGIIVLADNDYISLHLVSSVPANIVAVHNCHLTMHRIS